MIKVKNNIKELNRNTYKIIHKKEIDKKVKQE